jgi:hypothetical protein
MLRFKLDRRRCRGELAAQCARDRAHRAITAHDAREVERILAACARPAAMWRTSRSAAPTSRTCFSRSCGNHRRPGRGCPHGARRASPARTLLYKEVLRFWKVSFQTVAAPVLTAVLYLLIFGHVLEGHVRCSAGRELHRFLIPGW